MEGDRAVKPRDHCLEAAFAGHCCGVEGASSAEDGTSPLPDATASSQASGGAASAAGVSWAAAPNGEAMGKVTASAH